VGRETIYKVIQSKRGKERKKNPSFFRSPLKGAQKGNSPRIGFASKKDWKKKKDRRKIPIRQLPNA